MGDLDVCVIQHREMHRDRGLRSADANRHTVIVDQQFDLLRQVILEQVGPRDRGGIGAGFGDVAKGQTAVDMAIAGRGDANLRVEGAVAAVGHSRFDHLGKAGLKEVCRIGI